MHLGKVVFVISRRQKIAPACHSTPLNCLFLLVYRGAVPPVGLFVPHKAVTLFASPPSSSWLFPVFFIFPNSPANQPRSQSYQENNKALHSPCLGSPANRPQTPRYGHYDYDYQRYGLSGSLPVVLLTSPFPRQAVASTRSGSQRSSGQ
jgi:hypothetical protein